MESLKKENSLLFLVIAVGIIVLLGLVLQIFGFRVVEAGTNPRGIFVNGEGSISVKPDIVRISLGVEAEAPTAGEAQRENDELMGKVITVLKNLGLKEKDIQTTEFSLIPEREYIKGLNRYKVVGYRAMNQVTVSVRNLSKLGEVIDQSIKAGANNIQNVAFSVEFPEKWREQAIVKAVKDAKFKAEAMAKASGKRIAETISMGETTIEVSPYQIDGYERAAVLQDTAAANTPVESGNVKVTASVKINYRI